MKGERVNVNWWQVCGMCGWVVVHRVVPSVYIVGIAMWSQTLNFLIF
jgi:hypothetical protein